MLKIKLGSLFDGIGGFPLAGYKYGIEPVWASEIEPWPIKVTQKHFSGMIHLGDINQINGAEIEPVDVITFGSPCQDLSIAGKRAGLKGERSGLFSQAIRIIDEMREATNGAYPRFAAWENVHGAFSSNGGQDFRSVLEFFTNTAIPMPISGGWAGAGMVRTGTVDLAWRILDAQYWGVPQRRRRIFLVADFGGQSAPEVLFKREGLRRYIAESGEAREGTAADITRGLGETGAGYWKTRTQCLRAESENRAIGFSGKNSATMNMCPSEELSPTLRSGVETHVMTIDIVDKVARPLSAQPQMRYRLDMDNVVCSVDRRNHCENQELSGTLQAKAHGYSLNYQNPVRVGYMVRRLTPIECLRLQGYPDWWLDIEGMSDTQKYRAIGNSVAIPCVEFVLGSIAQVIEKGEGAA